VVTKKRRRKQIARASVERRNTRQQGRQHRRRFIQVLVTGLLVAAAVVALVAWIVLHDSPDGASPSVAGSSGDYDAASVDRTRPLSIEVTGE
jgi:hypothetical protein